MSGKNIITAIGERQTKSKAYGKSADKLLCALISTRSNRAAAAAANVHERTVYKYLSDPEFMARYKEAREDILREASNTIRDNMSGAAEVLCEIMYDKRNKPLDRVIAAKAVYEFGEKDLERNELNERAALLEKKMDQTEDDQADIYM